MEFKDLMGHTIIEITGKKGDDRMTLKTGDGKEYVMYHSQDCCESVAIEDIVGDLDDLLGEQLLEAEEVSGNTDPEGYKVPEYRDSFTWTFYKLGTRKGAVTVRWLGESNGYYSESVTFCEASKEGRW